MRPIQWQSLLLNPDNVQTFCLSDDDHLFLCQTSHFVLISLLLVFVFIIVQTWCLLVLLGELLAETYVLCSLNRVCE